LLTAFRFLRPSRWLLYSSIVAGSRGGSESIVFGVGQKRLDVAMPMHSRPVFRQYTPAPLVDLHLPGYLTARTLEPKVHAADPRK